MPLMNTSFTPESCRDYIQGMEDGPRKDIALVEYHYFSGQMDKAMQEAELYLICPDVACRFSACLIYAYANLSVGQIQHARYTLNPFPAICLHLVAEMDYMNLKQTEAHTAICWCIGNRMAGRPV
ncbi:hypothetical protein [Mordavella massiliensis]|uniref:Uncharacterized protein n=1 Tax=Mordavella massiliensis TaxID=1871024 RepID=A0A938X3T4_9CLOT|nr:hypothetical protein [Mordavella massiliensis]MBM6827887.1 hypothetical protein [Mordavella massiliensis]